MSKRSFTDEDFKIAIGGALNWTQVFKALNLCCTNSRRYTEFKLLAKRLDISCVHFCRSKTDNQIRKAKTALVDILQKGTHYDSHKLKKRLIKEGYKQHQCEGCKGTEWQGQLIPIELDHIDGNHINNELSNLRILCPNCHAQTSTYCRGLRTKIEHKCSCGKSISGSKCCRSCGNKQPPGERKTKIIWPSVIELTKLVWERPRSILALELGVSGKAIEKHCKRYGIEQPPRGYWAKVYAQQDNILVNIG